MAIRFLFIVYVVGLLAACDHERYPNKLVAADSLANTHPDSARKVLANMAADTVMMKKSQLMYYKLLTLKADIKSIIKQTSDVRAREILGYYEHEGDQRLLPYAYYYSASVYRDMHDAPQAIEYYQKVIDTLPNDVDLQLKSYTYNQIGKLFLFQSLYGKAAEFFYKSYQVDSIRKDTFDMFFSFIDMSIAYENSDITKCLNCLHKAELINMEGKLNLDYNVDYRLSVIYSDKKEYDSALIYIQEPLKNVAFTDSSAVFSVARKIYFGKGMLDSAEYYSLELMRMGSIYAKKNSSRTLGNIAFANGDTASGFKYMHLYDCWADSVEKIDAKRALANASSLYDYKIRERENTELKTERRNYIVGIFFLITISCVVITLLIIHSFRNKQKQQKQKLTIFLLKKLGKEQKEQNENEIKTREQEIKVLTKKLQETDKKNENLKIQIEEQKEELRRVIKNKNKGITKPNEQERKLLNSRAYFLAKSKVEEGKPILFSEWGKIENELDCLLVDFRYILYQTYSMSKLEYHICLLVKMGFNNSDISTLISRQPNAVSLSRKRLYKKLTGIEGKAADLDEYIKSL